MPTEVTRRSEIRRESNRLSRRGEGRRRAHRDRQRRSALEGKVVLITGATSGLGRELAIRVAGFGSRVVLVSRTPGDLKEVSEEIHSRGGSATPIPCDLSALDQVDELARDVVEDLGGVDVLVNNAAISIRRELAASLDRFRDVERTMQLNYFGPVRLIYALLPSMLERGHGHIINSITATVLFPCPRFAPYIASKSALAHFGEVLAMELMGNGIDVTNLYLPLVDTPMIKNVEAYHQDTMKQRRILRPISEVVEPILDAMVKRPARLTYRYWIGEVLRFASPYRTRSYMNRLFRSFPTTTCPVPDDTAFARRMRATWKNPPL